MENVRNKLAQKMFFLIPKNVTSERPVALMPTLIRWWEALRADNALIRKLAMLTCGSKFGKSYIC